MVDFEVIDIKANNDAFTVEIEITKTKERRFFGYPLGHGWQEELNGEPKFIRDIKRKLSEEELNKKELPNIENQLKSKIKGKKYRA